MEQYESQNAVIEKDLPMLGEIVGSTWKKEFEYITPFGTPNIRFSQIKSKKIACSILLSFLYQVLYIERPFGRAHEEDMKHECIMK